MSRIGIVGARKWSEEAASAAMDFVRGYLEGLPKYSTVVSGGHEFGVDKWVQQYFDRVKDKKRMHLVTYGPQHIPGQSYSALNYTERAKQIVSNVDKLVALLPEDYQGGTTSEVIALARVSHLPHQVVRITDKGALANVLEIKAKDTFITVPEVKLGLPKGSNDSESVSAESHVGKRTKRPARNSGSNNTSGSKSRTSSTVSAASARSRNDNNGKRKTQHAPITNHDGNTSSRTTGKGRRDDVQSRSKKLVLKRGKK